MLELGSLISIFVLSWGYIFILFLLCPLAFFSKTPLIGSLSLAPYLRRLTQGILRLGEFIGVALDTLFDFFECFYLWHNVQRLQYRILWHRLGSADRIFQHTVPRCCQYGWQWNPIMFLIERQSISVSESRLIFSDKFQIKSSSYVL